MFSLLAAGSCTLLELLVFFGDKKFRDLVRCLLDLSTYQQCVGEGEKTCRYGEGWSERGSSGTRLSLCACIQRLGLGVVA